MGEMPLWLRRINLGLQYWVKFSGCNHTFPVRCLLQEVAGANNRYNTFFCHINQWAGKMSMDQGGIREVF